MRVSTKPNSRRAGLVGRSTQEHHQIVGSDAGCRAREARSGDLAARDHRGYAEYLVITRRLTAAISPIPGWLRTGDLGSVSAAGDRHFPRPHQELINRGGERSRPARLEGVLTSNHPSVIRGSEKRRTQA